MPIRVAVIGGGSWGTTVAHLCAHNAPTVLYTRDRTVADAIDRTAENPRYLPGYRLHRALRATDRIDEAVAGAGVVMMGVPSHGFRAALRSLRPYLGSPVPVISLAKGLESDTTKPMTEVIADLLPGHPAGVLTGPNLAKEIMAGKAAAAVLAMTDTGVAEQLQGVFTTGWFRVYTNTDVVGSELAGALKNVIAVALGMADGLGVGDNARAALITRGLAEMTRLGVAMGGEPSTFAGLAGVGDLIATCISPQSRNHHVGQHLARGLSVAEIVAEMDQVAEGVKTAPVVASLAHRLGVDMPISEGVKAVVADNVSVAEVYRVLLDRPLTTEIR